MTADALAPLLWEDGGLRTSIRNITLRSAASDIPALNADIAQWGGQDWFHLLRCASVFLSCENEDFFSRGLRIVHGCIASDSSDAAKALAAALLAKIASNPSIELAKRRHLVRANILDELPLDLALDVQAHQIAATLNIGGDEFVGNNFQAELWRELSDKDWVSASAPTSAGKSFVLEKWIEHTVKTQAMSSTFYLVPTRALITQVETDLQTMLADRMDTINITSLPLQFAKKSAHNIYVYTQERFHLYLLKEEAIGQADLIVIDEAQQIGADRRGVLLQQVLELATQKYPSAKFLFASPSTENPESLLAFAPDGTETGVVAGTRGTVDQNLFWVEQVPFRPKLWDVNLMLDAEPVGVGRIALENKPSTRQKLAFIAYAIGGSAPGNVIYVNGAAEAEATAELLCQFFPDEIADPDLQALSEFCEKAVHPKFSLRRFVRKGVAFHYGNIPQLIRTEVERLFSAGKIKFLVCTSTLVEGVNLSCRNIYMRHPKRGRYNLMAPDDFWNLAGRAGRWGKEFQGNIFCIDPQRSNEWLAGSAPRSKRRHIIKIATQRIAVEFDDFITYVTERAEALEPVANKFHEQLFSYLIFRYSKFGDLGDVVTAGGLTPEQSDKLKAALEKTIAELKVPVEIVYRNPGINPYGINALYSHFASKHPSEFERLIPADPLSDAPVGSDGDVDDDEPRRDAAVDNFIGIFSRITTHLQGSLGVGVQAYGNALLVIHWMRGYPLARIIARQIKYWEQRGKNTPAIIRETMERVERVARFETPKYLHCYIDVLLFYFGQVGYKEMSGKVEDFWMYLEFGVSKKTQLSLMSLGLSRSSVTAISEYIKDDSLNEIQSLDWLATNSWPEFGLTRLTELEIEAVLRRHGRAISADSSA